MITVASDLKISASKLTITTAINDRVPALDASEGKALHDQHLSQTQDVVASYLKASLMHDYHL
jgi:hypothetical protein